MSADDDGHPHPTHRFPTAEDVAASPLGEGCMGCACLPGDYEAAEPCVGRCGCGGTGIAWLAEPGTEDDAIPDMREHYCSCPIGERRLQCDESGCVPGAGLHACGLKQRGAPGTCSDGERPT